MNNAEQTETKTRGALARIRRLALRMLLLFGFVYAALVVLLMANENYMVYPGSKYPRGDWQPGFAFEEVSFESEDGTRIVGWYLPLPGATENALICHGNAENVAQSARHSGLNFQSTLNANVFVFDYRGYGKSEGSPSEEGVLADAEAAMAWLNKKTNTKPDDVIIVGHSIGGGPAVHVAAKLGGKALCLQRTFASLIEPAQDLYWFIPVYYIMRNRYPSSERIEDCTVPLHQSHGDRDSVVPIESGRRLFDSSPASVKEFFVNRGKGHWDALPLDYWESVERFIAKVNSE